jgi:endoglucanase
MKQPYLTLLLALTTGCIGVSASRSAGGGAATAATPAGGGAAPAGGKSAGIAGTAPLKRCPAGTKPAADGLIDDFEDGNTQLLLAGDRDGYWYTAHDPVGSTVEPRPLKPEAGGADGGKALHVWGQTAAGAADAAWGMEVGAKFLNTSVLYDAAKYGGISFKAKVGEKSTRSFRFNIGDVNTHKDAELCTSCWNHFGKDLGLTGEWKEYVLTFAGAAQAPGWGDPRPAAIVPEKLVSMVWKTSGEQAYDLWIDDVRFVECQ